MSASPLWFNYTTQTTWEFFFFVFTWCACLERSVFHHGKPCYFFQRNLLSHEQNTLKIPRKLELLSYDRYHMMLNRGIILKWNRFIAHIIEKAGTRILNWWILLLFSRTLNSSSLFLLWKNARPNIFTAIMVTLEGINTPRSHHWSQRNCYQKCISVFSQEISIKWWDNGTYFIWRYKVFLQQKGWLVLVFSFMVCGSESNVNVNTEEIQST